MKKLSLAALCGIIFFLSNTSCTPPDPLEVATTPKLQEINNKTSVAPKVKEIPSETKAQKQAAESRLQEEAEVTLLFGCTIL